jgi:hypothetical protein
VHDFIHFLSEHLLTYFLPARKKIRLEKLVVQGEIRLALTKKEG